MKLNVKLRMLGTTLLLMLLVGCATQPKQLIPSTAQDNTKILLSHPEFSAAAQAAPNFVKESFRTITRLETELANAGK